MIVFNLLVYLSDKMLKKEIKLFINIIIPLLILLIIFYGAINVGIITFEKEKNNQDIITATVIIDYGNGKSDSYIIKSKNSTVYSFLLETSKQGNFKVDSTYYEEYNSYLINSINGYSSGQDNKYWIFYVNGEAGIQGANITPVENDDFIEWKFEEYSY